MTVNSTNVSVTYAGDGVTQNFVFNMKTFDTSWITATVDGVPTAVTVTLNADQNASPGGNVLFVPAPADMSEIVITRTADLLQQTSYPPFGRFPAEDHEAALDKLTLITQQLTTDQDALEAIADSLGTAAFAETPEVTDLDALVSEGSGFYTYNIGTTGAPTAQGGGVTQYELGLAGLDGHIQVATTIFGEIWSRVYDSFSMSWGAWLSASTGSIFPIDATDVEFDATGTIFDGTTTNLQTAIGLFGDAALATLQASSTDSTADSVLTVGAFGLGDTSVLILDPDTITDSGFYRYQSSWGANPEPGVNGVIQHQAYSATTHMQTATSQAGNVYVRVATGGVFGAWSSVGAGGGSGTFDSIFYESPSVNQPITDLEAANTFFTSASYSTTGGVTEQVLGGASGLCYDLKIAGNTVDDTQLGSALFNINFTKHNGAGGEQSLDFYDNAFAIFNNGTKRFTVTGGGFTWINGPLSIGVGAYYTGDNGLSVYSATAPGFGGDDMGVVFADAGIETNIQYPDTPTNNAYFAASYQDINGGALFSTYGVNERAFHLRAITEIATDLATPGFGVIDLDAIRYNDGGGVLQAWADDDKILTVSNDGSPVVIATGAGDLAISRTFISQTLAAPAGVYSAEFRDGNVTHGVTTILPTNAFAALGKDSVSAGGLQLTAINDAGARALTTLAISTAPSTAAFGAGIIDLQARTASGTGTAEPSGTDSIFSVSTSDINRAMQLDASGNLNLQGDVTANGVLLTGGGVGTNLEIDGSIVTGGGTLPGNLDTGGMFSDVTDDGGDELFWRIDYDTTNHGITDIAQSTNNIATFRQGPNSGGMQIETFGGVGFLNYVYAETTSAAGFFGAYTVGVAAKSGANATNVPDADYAFAFQNNSTNLLHILGNGDTTIAGDLTVAGSINGSIALTDLELSGSIATGGFTLPGTEATGSLYVYTGSITSPIISTYWLNDTVSQPVTSVAPANAYATIGLAASTTGGVTMRGFGEDDEGITLRGYTVTPLTDLLPTERGPINIDARKTDGGTGSAAFASNENIFSVFNNSTLNSAALAVRGDGILANASSIITGGGAIPANNSAGSLISHTTDSQPYQFLLSNSNVNHTFTTFNSANVFLDTRMVQTDNGGVWFRGYSETNCGIYLTGLGTTVSTVAGDNSLAAVVFDARKWNGATSADPLAATEMAFKWFSGGSGGNELAAMNGGGNLFLAGSVLTGGITAAYASAAPGSIETMLEDAGGRGAVMTCFGAPTRVIHPFTALDPANMSFKIESNNNQGRFEVTAYSEGSTANQYTSYVTVSGSGSNGAPHAFHAYKTDGGTGATALDDDEQMLRLYNGSPSVYNMEILGDGTIRSLSGLSFNDAAQHAGALAGKELSADPSDPAEGEFVVWMSDGTGSGDDGDIMLKITAGAVTKTVTLVDFSAV